VLFYSPSPVFHISPQSAVQNWHFQNVLDNSDNVRFTAETGDVVFFSPQWWHQTYVPGDTASTALTFYAARPCGFGAPLTFFTALWNEMLCGRVRDRDGHDLMAYFKNCYEFWFECDENPQARPPKTAEEASCH
jgi:hypothetical protein